MPISYTHETIVTTLTTGVMMKKMIVSGWEEEKKKKERERLELELENLSTQG